MKKMKTKTLVLIGLAVCAILLTSPVLASAGYSKIYGNANEDDTLDMRDVTYIKLVIFGKKPATTLADANYDGKISMLDIGQTKLIILGKEKKLTLLDQADRTVAVPRPIERVVVSTDGVRTIVQLGAVDKLVGVPDFKRLESLMAGMAYPQLKELPDTGMLYSNVNTELIVSLKPDVIFAPSGGEYTAALNTIQDKTDIPVVGVRVSGNLDLEIYRLLGEIIEKEKEAEELISYANEKIGEITEVTSQMNENEKPRVYLAMWTFRGMITRTPTCYDPVDLAGGINVAEGYTTGGYGIDVSKEQIIAWDPDIILLGCCLPGPPGKNPKYNAVGIEDVLSDPNLQTINAVKSKSIYYTKGFGWGWDPATGLTETFYMAKIFHPDKFEDLDVDKEGNEILERFYGVDGLHTWISSYYEYELHPKPWE
jgi:iron complex transport system substrate-binding protein